MALYISDSCIGCTFCQNECPVMAISYDGDKYCIDNDLCIRCGTCSKVCVMDAIEDTEAPREAPLPHAPVEKKCDFLVVGGGAAGLVAAAKVAEQGRKVIILEKNRKPGGGGYFAVGLTPCNTQWEKNAGVPDCIEEKVSRAMAQTKNKLEEAMMRSLFTSLGEVFDWLCTWAPVEKCFQLAPHPFTGEMSVGTKDQGYGSGKFITTHILPYLKKLGVEILTETAAEELKLDEAGAVSGVTARDPGGILNISCKNCLLATGSLIRSERIREMIPEFAQADVKRYAHDMPTLTGDGLTLAEKAGIPLNKDSIVLAFVGCMPVAFEQGAFQMGERKDALRINLDGKRWVDETADGKTMAEKLLYQPKAVSYTVLDSSILESKEPVPPMPAGGPGGPGGPGGGMPYPGGVPDFAVTRTSPTPGDREAFRALAKKVNEKTVICGDTIEELAEKMGAPADVLKATVEGYNVLCQTGRDTEFGKNSLYLRPLKEGPYFAIRNYLYLDGVFGGLDVSPNMEVLANGKVVPGLYAAGDITCGRYTNDLMHKNEVINDYSWAIAGGYMAAKHIIGM